MKSHSKSSSLGTPWLTKKHKDITAKHQDGMIAGIRNASIRDIFLDPRIFILQQQGKERWGWGVGVNGHAHRYAPFYLPSKFFFSSELRRPSGTTLHHGISPLANENV